jgi:ribonuclease BN (tRNA processing enzyme)
MPDGRISVRERGVEGNRDRHGDLPSLGTSTRGATDHRLDAICSDRVAQNAYGGALMHRLLLAIASVVSMGCAHAEAAHAVSKGAAAACAPLASSTSPFELVVLGSGGPVSFGRASSGYVVFIDGVARALVDVGPGAFVRLGEMSIDLHRIDTILLTHLHVDHSGDLPGFVKSRDLTFDEPLVFKIFGPSGGGAYPSTTGFVDRLFGAQGAFAYLSKFRNTLALEPVDLPIAYDAPIHEVLREADFHVTSIAVDHGDVPAVAFRIEHAGHAVVISGDLASKNDNLARLAEGTDLLVYDTSVLDPPDAPPKLYELHTAPKRIGEVAAKARVKSLLFSHIPPDVEQSEEAVVRSVRASYGGPARFASDCLRIDLAK